MSDADKLNRFLSELLRYGCLRGFKYFSLYLRGREELEVCLPHPRKTNALNRSYSVRSIRGFLEPLPQGLPPASPTSSELPRSQDDTLFLIAAYAKYKCAYVWLRSNHDRILRPDVISTGGDKDAPLTLTSTSNWKNVPRTYLWEVIAEIVGLTVSPAPANPFAVDYHQLDQVPAFERTFLTAGMLHFLRRVWLARPPYQDAVLADIKQLADRHFADLPKVILDGRKDGGHKYSLLGQQS